MGYPERMVMSVCDSCGSPYERLTSGAKCPECRPTERERNRYTPKRKYRDAGYDHHWDKLSKRARELSPFCQKCGATEDLTGDHTPEAWKRKEAGKVIRLVDIVVLCRSCNSSAGPARGARIRRDADSTTSTRRRSSAPMPLTDDLDAPPPF